MANVKAPVDVRDAILNKMKAEGRSLTWLASKTKINYNTIHSCLSRKLFTLSVENLKKINKELGSDFIDAEK